MRWFKIFSGVVVLMAITNCQLFGQDIIIFKNGDELNGEIKTLNEGVLKMETSYSDSDFQIEWDRVERIVSSRFFTILLSSKEKIFASFNTSGKPGYTILSGGGQYFREVRMPDIVIIDPIEEGFADRFDASISAGLTFTKANNSRQVSVRATMGYQSRDWHLTGNFNDVVNTQDNVEDIRRTDGSVDLSYLFYRNWFTALNNDFLSNTEQQIALRNTHTLALGNLIVRNNRMFLSGSAGITYNRENYSNESEVLNSSEAFFGLTYKAFDVGDLDFYTKVSYFPSLTESRRNRVNLQVDLKYELPLDFFVKFGYTLNFDSKPPNDGARDDYVFQSTVGWEF